MLLTTTHTVQDAKVTAYVGIVSGQAILGANILKDLLAGIRDVVGGRSTAYEKELARAREIALSELEEQAKKLDAHGVVGIELDYQTLGQGSMLMVTASGTAVTFRER